MHMHSDETEAALIAAQGLDPRMRVTRYLEDGTLFAYLDSELWVEQGMDQYHRSSVSAVQPMFLLKAVEDSTGLIWVMHQTQEGTPCERCWLRDGSRSHAYIDHVAVPMQAPRYI